jgi:hypothetical protein
MKSPASVTEANGRSSELQGWVLFCFSVFALKVVFLAIDPLPKLVMGDSGSYIWTAVSGWIPPDRSYFYGYLIRWTSLGTESLTSLLVLQVCLSTITCILLASICRFIFALPARWAYSFGLLCAIDPLQLLWERYVMTETTSLCLYAFVLWHSLFYLKKRRLRDLVIIQAISVVLIGFRMSFLLLVQVNAVILPLIAFTPDILRRLRRGSREDAPWLSGVRVCGGHLLVSVVLLFMLHTGYKRANGWVTNQEPAYLYATGVTLLAFLSPILQPQDSTDPRLADLIRGGDEFGLRDLELRNHQRFAPGCLIDRLSQLVPDPMKADRLAKKTALHAMRRDVIGLLGLGLKNYSLYWKGVATKTLAEADFSFTNAPNTDLIALFASRFHLSHDNAPIKSFLQRYYVAAWPYYLILLASPLLASLTIALRSTRLYAVLLFIHVSLVLVVPVIFAGAALRYLQPVSLLTLLLIALWTKTLLTNRGKKTEPMTDERWINLQSAPPPRPDLSNLAQPAFI